MVVVTVAVVAAAAGAAGTAVVVVVEEEEEEEAAAAAAATRRTQRSMHWPRTGTLDPSRSLLPIANDVPARLQRVFDASLGLPAVRREQKVDSAVVHVHTLRQVRVYLRPGKEGQGGVRVIGRLILWHRSKA